MTESTESKVKIEGKFYPLQHQEWVKACRELTSGARDTLYYIRTTDPYSNGIELTAAAIAKELGVNRSTISRAMKELDSKGFIEHDSGFIVRSELVIDGLNPNDPDPLCNRNGCGAASGYRNLGLDDRIPSEVCQQIHEWEVQSWAETSHQKWLQTKERIDQLSQGSNRNDNDEREIKIRKENAQAELDLAVKNNV